MTEKHAEFIKNNFIYKPDHNFWQFCKLKPGDTYIDGGAFIGRNALHASKMLGPTGRIISIEAQPDTYNLLLETIDTFSLQEIVTPINIVLWDKKGAINWREHFGSGHVNPSGALLLEADTLEHVLESFGIKIVNLLSLDVEASEPYVLRGVGKYLKDHLIEHLAICAYHKSDHLGEQRVAIIKILQDNQYIINGTEDFTNPANQVIYASSKEL